MVILILQPYNKLVKVDPCAKLLWQKRAYNGGQHSLATQRGLGSSNPISPGIFKTTIRVCRTDWPIWRRRYQSQSLSTTYRGFLTRELRMLHPPWSNSKATLCGIPSLAPCKAHTEGQLA